MKYLSAFLILVALINIGTTIANAVLFHRDHVWWTRSGCIDGVGYAFTKLPIDFYGDNEKLLNVVWDDAVKQCGAKK